MNFQAGCDVNPPRSGAKEVHGGDEGGLEPPGGAGAASRDTEGGGGDPGVGAACSQAVVCVERPGQAGEAPLRHHLQLWGNSQTQRGGGVKRLSSQAPRRFLQF